MFVSSGNRHVIVSQSKKMYTPANASRLRDGYRVQCVIVLTTYSMRESSMAVVVCLRAFQVKIISHGWAETVLPLPPPN